MSRERRMITVEEARSQMPQVGDRMWKAPTLHKSLGTTDARPRLCTVIHVNREHLWYTVRFDSGFTQSYKVPELREEEGR